MYILQENTRLHEEDSPDAPNEIDENEDAHNMRWRGISRQGGRIDSEHSNWPEETWRGYFRQAMEKKICLPMSRQCLHTQIYTRRDQNCFKIRTARHNHVGKT